jgi:tRNA-uridine 2-sulfurtransferase
VGEVGLREFLRQYVDAQPGPVLTAAGTRIGTHQGALFYTHGQRHGLGIGGGRPFYVIGTDIATNTVFVTDDPVDPVLETDHFTLTQTHWILGAPESGRTYQVRSRHRADLINCTIAHDEVRMVRPERAVTPGQSAVIYDGDTVLGGGIIS